MSSSWQIDKADCQIGDFVTIVMVEDGMKFTGLLQDVNPLYLLLDGRGFPLESIEDVLPY